MNRRTAISTLALAAAPAIAGPVGLRLPGGFDPRQIPGLQLWLDASQIVGLNDGDAVATWSDLSGNGRNATQSTASQKPIYKTGIKNGLPVVRFDGVDDNLAGTLSGISGNQPNTIYAVLKMNGDAQCAWAFGTAAVGQGIFFPFRNVGAWSYGQYAMDITSASSADANWHQQTGWKSGNPLEVFIDGVSVASGSPGATNYTGTTFNVGMLLGLGYYLSGDVAEFLFYDSAHDLATRQQVQNYLKSKWGTP